MTTGTTEKMKAMKASKTCAVCTKESKQLSDEDGGLCPTCLNIVDLLKNKPDVLHRYFLPAVGSCREGTSRCS
jgi:hypothetical protein